MLTLDSLAEKHGTDKGSVPVSGLYPKHYTRLYERYFAHLRDEEITLLEIGVQAGASLRMWEEILPRHASLASTSIRSVSATPPTARLS